MLLLAAALALSACAASQTGVGSADRSRYTSVAIVPDINDRLVTVYWANALSSPSSSEARLGWNAAKGAGQISAEILSHTGASVTVSSDPTGSAARSAEVAVILRQTPLNALAQSYNPGQDILLSGVSVAGAAAAGGMATVSIRGERGFQPRSVLHVKGGGVRGRSQLDLCAVGITPYLVDPKTGETLKKGRPLTGIEKISLGASGRSWQSFSATERATILAYCQSALRRAISQAFVELDIVD
ncbi:hypothetical protein [Ovoidimarina sediminis]|uniref:hypothetical protein n=1 Tax=Ovoidimarina sediminis TaxID=3079856 RepID=UPI002915C212|nr:hypothetical protein [Rhodophyticola sp. MJ-SS7]MDU8946540.1 hypothetical protein [Rhodophyticola sp. MJ-SS7]